MLIKRIELYLLTLFKQEEFWIFVLNAEDQFPKKYLKVITEKGMFATIVDTYIIKIQML